jgi:predicted transcriptional regulator
LGDITSVFEDDTVFSAIATMERLGIGAVLVKNNDGQYTGIAIVTRVNPVTRSNDSLIDWNKAYLANVII